MNTKRSTARSTSSKDLVYSECCKEVFGVRPWPDLWSLRQSPRSRLFVQVSYSLVHIKQAQARLSARGEET
jgi:hypothetical protein